jgi:ubiquitin-conjugating enzyme E2 M
MALSLYSVGRKRRKKQQAQNQGPTAAKLRMQSDIEVIDELPAEVTIDFPNGTEDLLNFNCQIEVSDGLWEGGVYTFVFAIPEDYPHKPPKVTLTEKIYHPNIDYDGNVCLNVLKADWRPILSIEQVIIGLATGAELSF